jgi:cyclophilin family peptidyl-prolyl cis-trans isomerase
MKKYIPILVVVVILALGALFLKAGNNKPTQEKEIIPQDLSIPVSSATITPMTTPSNIVPIAEKVNVTLKTNMGDIALELDGTTAPITVGNFVGLAQKAFYDGTTFHRVIPDFMIQGGDPNSKDQTKKYTHGTGGPGYQFADEINSNKIVRGTIAMANAGPNTNGSQFFIVTAPATPYLDGKHTYFGKVISGMDVVDKISLVQRDENDNPLSPVTINQVVVEK